MIICIRETEVCDVKIKCIVFRDGYCFVCTGRCIVDWQYINGDPIFGGVNVSSTVESAAAVLNLKGETVVTDTIVICRRNKL